MVGSPLTMILLVAFNSSLFVFNSSVKDYFRQIFRPDFYHHAGVAPFGAAVAGTHAVYYNLMRTACGRNNKSSRTHTKTIDTTSFYLCHKAIFSGRQILSTSVFIMILYLVNQHGRVFQTYSYCNSFGFHLYTIVIQPPIHIPCGMSGSQNNRSFESLSGICFYTCDFVFSIIRESIRVSKCTSPPHSMMVFRIFSITRGNLSVPMWGWASARMEVLAPCWQNTFRILFTFPRFLLRV